jgi:hypothetical protein
MDTIDTIDILIGTATVSLPSNRFSIARGEKFDTIDDYSFNETEVLKILNSLTNEKICHETGCPEALDLFDSLIDSRWPGIDNSSFMTNKNWTFRDLKDQLGHIYTLVVRLPKNYCNLSRRPTAFNLSLLEKIPGDEYYQRYQDPYWHICPDCS